MPKDTIRIEINGQNFDTFKTAIVTMRLDAVCRFFSFTSSTDINFNIGNDTICKVFINEELVLKGYIETLSPSVDALSHEIYITGRSLLSDLVDSSIPANIKRAKNIVNFEVMPIKQLIKKITSRYSKLVYRPIIHKQIQSKK